MISYNSLAVIDLSCETALTNESESIIRILGQLYSYLFLLCVSLECVPTAKVRY